MSTNDYRTLSEGMPMAVAERTILRKISDISRESWADVAQRVALGNAMLCPNAADVESERIALERVIGKATVLLSGRHLQHGDKDQPKRGQEVFTNCSTASTSFLLFYLLLNGSGVGRSYDNDLMMVDWDNAPNLRCVLSDTHPDFDRSRHESARDARHKYGTGKNVMWYEVDDSREGWAKALEMWENLAFEKIHRDRLLILDFSMIRPRGSPIGGMQNRPASGPRELMDAFEKSAKLKGSGLAPWKQAMYVDHYFAECVLVGGARRAARIATKTWRDKNVLEFVTVKRPLEYIGKTPAEIQEIQKAGKPLPFLWSSNNSVAVDAEFWSLVKGGKGDAELRDHAKRVFESMCEASYYDGTGEPGMINVDRLTQKDEGYKELLSGSYVGSRKFQVNEDTHLYLAKIARKARSKLYSMICNPCSEICLTVVGGFCVIADVVPFHATTIDEAEDAFRVATRALIRVNLMDSIYSKEVKRTNRIGVGMTGIHEFAWKFFKLGFRDLIDEKKSREFWMTLARFNRAVRDEAERYSKQLGVCMPHTLTTIKPAGTTSKLFMLTEGWHLPSMREFLRWVQFRMDDPLVKDYQKRGYPVRELKTYSGTAIVGFPTAPTITQLGMGDKLLTAAEATPEEQYKWLMLGEKYWIDGVTESGKPHAEPYGNQISYCLAGDKRHLVTTARGLERIEAIQRGYTQNRDGEKQEIIALVDNGVQDTLAVRLENGTEIVGTAEHRLLVVERDLAFIWKHMKDLQKGDIVVRRLGNPQSPTDYCRLPEFQNVRSDGRRGNVADCSVPTILDERFGLFIGMLMSDGNLQENGIAITTADTVVADTFAALLHELFGLRSVTDSDLRAPNVLRVNANSRPLVRWLCERVGVSLYHDNNAVPDLILQSPSSVQRAFIRGYTLDGYAISSSGIACVCSTVSQTMARDMAALLWSLGLDASVGRKDGRPYSFSASNSGIGKDQWTVLLGGADSKSFERDIGFLEERKNVIVRSAAPCSMPHRSNSVWADRFHEEYAQKPTGGEPLRRVMKAKSNRIAVENVRRHFENEWFCQHILDPNLRFTAVSDIADGGKHHTYDITVDVSHEYVANAVVVHNTLKYNPAKVAYEDFRAMLMEYQSRIKCCSVMPQVDSSAYEYQPEQPVTSEEYTALVSKVSRAREDVDFAHVDCGNGACPVDFKK